MRSILAGVLLMVQVQAPAQDQYERQVRRQLDETGMELRPRGFELSFQLHIGRLKQGQTETVGFQLQPGRTYAFVATCDEDCSDLDSSLADPAGREVASDRGDDDVPVVEVRPERPGEYELTVDMATCKSDPCTYGIGVYANGLDEADRMLLVQLESRIKELGRQGFRISHPVMTGALEPKAYKDAVVQLEAGGTSMILGVCDTDCDALNLEIRDSANRRVAIDDKNDDVPAVSVEPSRSEKYTVRATMAACDHRPCRYALGVVRRAPPRRP